MASEVEIANRALQRLGEGRITALTEASVSARAITTAFATVRDAELRAHPWNFSVKRAQLAASGTAPAFGPANAFALPSDFLRLLPQDVGRQANDSDWVIEGQSILTDDSTPLEIRYVRRVTDPNQMDPLFREALALRLAKELCEQITQSNTKIQLINSDYQAIIAKARNADAMEVPAEEPPEDTWVTVRL